jgi:hypothetical protein
VSSQQGHPTEPGWTQVGRDAYSAGRDLTINVSYLGGAPSEPLGQAGPGAGKSAVLGRIVTTGQRLTLHWRLATVIVGHWSQSVRSCWVYHPRINTQIMPARQRWRHHCR